MDLTQEELYQEVDYNPETGVFNWKTKCTRHKAKHEVGDIAGLKGRIRFYKGSEYRDFQLSHLAWLYVYGELPRCQLETLDLNPRNVAIDNLRKLGCGTGNTRIELTLEELHRCLDYNPNTGIFTWKVLLYRYKHKVGDIAGHLWQDKRRQADKPMVIIRLTVRNGVLKQRLTFKGHHLAWFYVHRVWPTHIIDHIDRNPANNAINNLREVSDAESAQNRGVNRNNKLGIKGVRKAPWGGAGYEARISINGQAWRRIFTTIPEAEQWLKHMRLTHGSAYTEL